MWTVRSVKCPGVLFCNNCYLVFPTSQKKKICSSKCQEPLQRKLCKGRFYHYQSGNDEMLCLDLSHSHNEPNFSKIDALSRKTIRKCIENNPSVKPKDLIVGKGIEGNIFLQQLNPALANSQRVQYIVRTERKNMYGGDGLDIGKVATIMRALKMKEEKNFTQCMFKIVFS